MSFANDAEFEAFIASDSLLPMITSEAVGDALLDFALTPPAEMTLGWLAMAIRRSLAASKRNASDGAQRKSNAEIRTELNSLAKKAGKAWVAISDRSGEADTRFFEHAFENWSGQNALAAVEDPEFSYNAFHDALGRLEWLANWLTSAAQSTAQQQANWRRAEERYERIDRARCLAPVFEKVFGQKVSANNWSGSAWSGDALAKGPTPFMDFYQRMARLGFGENAIPDVSGVTKEACRLHRQEPFSFEGIIPGM